MAVNWDEFTPVEESSSSDGSIDWNQFTPIEEPQKRIEPPAEISAAASTAGGLIGAAQRGIERAKIIPEVISLPTLRQAAAPTMRQERRAFEQAMTDPSYFAASTIPGVSPLEVESRFGPASQLERMKFAPRSAVTETVRDISEAQKKISKIPQSEAQKRMGNAETQGDKWKTWLSDPVELTASIILESLPPAIAGAVVGSAGGPVGTAVGAGAASGLTEFSSTFLEEASNSGYDIKDPSRLEAFLNDSKAYDRAIEKGMTRGGIVGGVDAITAGTAGKFLKPALSQALKQRVVASGKELGVQALGGSAGEAAAQVATGQPLDPFDIAMEAIAEIGTGPAEVASNLRGQTAAVPPRPAEPPSVPAEPVPPNPVEPPPVPTEPEAPKTAEVQPEVSEFVQRYETRNLPPSNATAIAIDAGMKAKGIPDLQTMLDALVRVTTPLRIARDAHAAEMKNPNPDQAKLDAYAQKMNKGAGSQFAREAIEAAAGIGGQKRSDSPLNFRNNPEIARWLRDNATVIWAAKPGYTANLDANIAQLDEVLSKEVKNEEETQEEVLTPETAEATEVVGMGGATPSELNIGTGLANAVGKQERVGFGLPQAYPTVSRKMLPVWNASAEVLRQDPRAGEKLAAELKINPERGMTDEDSALLLRHKVALENAKNQAAEDSITAGTPEAKQEAMDRFDNISNQLLDLLDAAKFRGSQWGREGRWRQALAFEDYSFESMRRQKRMKADRELTPEEEAETKREYEVISDKQKSAEEARTKDEQKAREEQVKEVVADTVKTAKTQQAKQKAAGVVRDLAAEQTEVINYLKDHFIENGDLSDARSSIRKLMELLVENEGITERLPLETRVHEILSGVDPTLTREGAMDLMSLYGQSKLPSQEPVKKTVRDIVQQIISVRKLLDYFKGRRPSLTGMLRDAPSAIQQDWLKMVNEAKKVFKLDVPTDNAKSIKSATDAINTRLTNRIREVKQEIATRQKIIRERSPSPYNAETLRLRQELESLLKEHAEIFGSGLTPAQQLDRLEKAADRQIKELQRQIDSGEIFSKSKQAIGLRSEKLDAARAKIEELKLQRQFAREASQPRPEPEVARNEARVKALDKQIAAIEKQLADDAVFSKAKKERTPSEDARVLDREKKLAELKQERQFARARNQPGMEPHEQFLLNYLLRIRQREAAYKEKLAKGEFEKQPKPKRELSPDVLSALADVEKAKSDFQRGLHKYELSRRSRIQKIWDGIRNTKNAFVNIISSYDFSAPRQAFGAILANVSRLVTSPVRGSKLLAIPFQKMFQAWSGEHRSATIDQWIKNRPNATSGADKAAGIQYTDLHSETFSKREENARSILDDWAALPLRTGNALKSTVTFLPKVGAKGVRMSNRAFITYLNTTRALLFDELLRANFQDRAPTEAQLKVLGNIVNLSTGRGALNQGVARVASEILWAPSLLTSRVQLLTGHPFWGKAGREGGGKARLIVAKEYARWITSAAVLFAISRMFDDKEEEEPTSSDFGKVVRGNTRIDPWAGFQQVAVLMARIRAGETTSIQGQTRNITKTGTGEVVWNFFKNKTRPDLVAIVKATVAAIDLGKEGKSVRVTPLEAAKGAIPAPLAIREVIEVMRDRGMSEGAIVEVLALFGAGVSVYEEREAQK